MPSFYVYRLTMGAHVQSGVAACYSVDEYDRGLIKNHEQTRPDKDDDRTRHALAAVVRHVAQVAFRKLDGLCLRVHEQIAAAGFSALLIAEGRLHTPAQARQCLDAGAFAKEGLVFSPHAHVIGAIRLCGRSADAGA